jgi:hypothetical protein
MEYLKSLTRHWLTWAFSAAVIWLVATFQLSEADMNVLTAEFAKITNSVLVVLVLIAPLVGRFVLTWFSTFFRTGSGEPKDKTTGASGGASLWCVLGTAAALLMTTIALPSCTSAQWAAARAIPIRIGIAGPDAAVGYSSKSGLQVDYVIRATK